MDFVLSGPAEGSKAIEAKFDSNQVNMKKYKLFTSAYPEIPLQFLWLNPFNEDFFRKINLKV